MIKNNTIEIHCVAQPIMLLGTDVY